MQQSGQPHRSAHPYAARWRLLRRIYRHLNTLSHHLVGLCLKLIVVGYLVFCILFLVLRYAVLPNIGNYKAEIEYFLTSSVGRSVSIKQVSASWQGLRPSIQLDELTILDQHGQNALVLPDVNVTVSWLSLLFGQARFYDLEINQPELALQRSVDGKIYVAGWWIDPQQTGDMQGQRQGLDWLLSQRQINIKNGVVHWTDAQRAAPPLTLSHVDFVLQNDWRKHTLSLSATPPANLSGPLDIRASFTHPAFSHPKSDFTRWAGVLYANFSRTDLAAWKSYIDYPFPVEQGNGAVRAWLTFDQARIVDFTADLQLANVKAWLRKDLPMLDLLHVSGRISAQEIARQGILPMLDPRSTDSVLDSGHQIALTKLTFETQDGLRLPPTTMSEKYIPASKGQAEQLEVAAQFVDLNVLTNLIEHMPMPSEYIGLLKNFAPAGQVSELSVKLQGQYPKLEHFQIKGKFSNLALLPQPARLAGPNQIAMPATPGVSNLTGSVDLNDRQGELQLASTNLTLHMPEIMTEPDLHFDTLALHANWALTPGRELRINLTKLDLLQDKMEAHFSGSHVLSLNPALPQAPGVLDLTGSVNQIELQKIAHFLPLGMQPDLYKWLSSGLEHGQVNQVTVRVRGDLAEFPFPKKGLLDSNLFYIAGNIEDARINYLPGILHKDSASPYWPVLSKIHGKIVFDRESLEIEAESAETAGIVVTKVKAAVPNLYGADATLNIDGLAAAPAQDMLHYVTIGPVLEWISNFTQDTHATGNARLKLRLELPLFHIIDAKVLADLQLLGNDVNLIPDLPVLTQASGHISFTEKGLSLSGMHANFLGGPVTVVGGSQKDNVIRFKADGELLMDGVRKEYPQPELMPLLARSDGSLPYSAIIQVKNRRTEIWVDSTLQGVALRLPAPLNKAAADILPMHFEMTVLPAAVGASAAAVPAAAANAAVSTAPERDELKLSLGKGLNAHYLRQRNAENEASHVISGGIGVNAAALSPDSGISVNLNLTSLNVDELQSLMPSSGADLSNGAASVATVSTHSGLALAPYLQIDKIALHASDVILMGKKLDQVVFGATRNNGDWQANIDSRQISGRLTWSNTEHGLGNISARLTALTIPASAAGDIADLLQNKTITTSIPGLDIEADHLELFGKKLGRLELQAKNSQLVGAAGDTEWHIDKLVLTNPDAVLTAQGKWSSGTGHSATPLTALSYQLDLHDAGKLLERFGYAQAVAGGKGRLSGDISWAGSPYALDIPSLTGKVRLDLQSGQFLKVDPGAAKLLAVLNMQALPRRLLLDFRDVFSDGFAFDGITGDAQIEKGEAKTDNLKMRGVAATVLLSGTADIGHETQDLHVVVVPEINAGAASVVYGLAVNPVIGLGTFLAQLFLREPLMKAFTFEYQITGSWKEPNVVKLSNNASLLPKPAASDQGKQP